jgi:Bacterial Ig domain/WD40-like Beta Propeller Repeat
MTGSRAGTAVVAVAVVATALWALPATAGAVLSGTNGNIVFASGRGEANDTTAKLYLRRTFSSTGGPATSSPPIVATGGVQHRHPTWSPDRTKIAYAAGSAGNFDIFILDLTQPGATPQNITNSNNVTDDRPAWSPDGTRIAYESEVVDGSNKTDILVDTLPPGSPMNLTGPGVANVYETKPAWTANSQTIYYVIGNPDPGMTNTMGIVSRPATGGSETTWLNDPGISEFQPSISPDGTQMCFTLGSGFNGTADVRVAAINNPAGSIDLSDNVGTMSQHGDYNCTWSPDGTQVAYVRGTFADGDLVMERADDSSLVPIELEETVNRFDGNPDWAPDGRPSCDDITVTTKINTPVTIPLPCQDTGPQYERTTVRFDVPSDASPANGTTTEPLDGLNTTYTPNQGFTGTDTFQVRPRDEIAFGTQRGTVTVNVRKQFNGFDIVRVKKNKKKGTARLTVSVDEGPGDLALASRKAKPAEAPVGDGQDVTQTLRVKAKGKAKRKLKTKGKAKVTVDVTYTPDLGDPNTKSQKVKLKRKLK